MRNKVWGILKKGVEAAANKLAKHDEEDIKALAREAVSNLANALMHKGAPNSPLK